MKGTSKSQREKLRKKARAYIHETLSALLDACLKEMGEEIKLKIELIEHDIYNDAGCEFNIASPKELGNILFEKLKLPHGKKTARGYSTSIDVLNKLVDDHPIINRIIEYRMLTKLYST